MGKERSPIAGHSADEKGGSSSGGNFVGLDLSMLNHSSSDSSSGAFSFGAGLNEEISGAVLLDTQTKDEEDIVFDGLYSFFKKFFC